VVRRDEEPVVVDEEAGPADLDDRSVGVLVGLEDGEDRGGDRLDGVSEHQDSSRIPGVPPR
jgi:hypothetical protein